MAAPLTTIRKNSKEELRVGIEQFNGRDIFNARTWFAGDDGQTRPGKGVAFKVSLLPDFAKGVAAALAEAKRRGLLR